MNQDVNPLLAILILIVFLTPIALMYYFSSKEAESTVGSFYLTDMRDGSFMVQVDDLMLRHNPATGETSSQDTLSFGRRSQIGVLADGDTLVRSHDWNQSVSLYLSMGDSSPDTEEQAAIDETREKAALHDYSGDSTILRCDSNFGNCSPFFEGVRRFSLSYNVRVRPDDNTVFISDGYKHEISLYTADGLLVSSYDKDLRFPKRVELAEDGGIYFANTNRHRIERFKPGEKPLGTDEWYDALPPLYVGEAATADSEYIWPLAVRKLGADWWVINMGDGMRQGRLFRFSENGDYIETFMPDGEVLPMDLLELGGELLVSDAYSGEIHRIDTSGQLGSPIVIDELVSYVAASTQKRELYKTLGRVTTWVFALLLIAVILTLLRWS